jgi:tetratricopeptide (TPR) repeat protein
MGFRTLNVSELDPIHAAGLHWLPLRHLLGVQAFGVNAYTADKVGDRVVEEHTELNAQHEELYVVVRGRARFTLDGEEIDAPAGTLVFLRDPAVRRGAIAAEANTTVLAIGGRPGAAFAPSAWETFFAAYAYRELGDHERGHQLLRAAVEREPERAVFQYHLACFASLGGDRAAALEHLNRAVGLDPDTARWAASDSDLDWIRDDPGFPEAESAP